MRLPVLPSAGALPLHARVLAVDEPAVANHLDPVRPGRQPAVRQRSHHLRACCGQQAVDGWLVELCAAEQPSQAAVACAADISRLPGLIRRPCPHPPARRLTTGSPPRSAHSWRPPLATPSTWCGGAASSWPPTASSSGVRAGRAGLQGQDVAPGIAMPAGRCRNSPSSP